MSDLSEISETGYDSDEILSQALDVFEEQETNDIFTTQNTYSDIPDDEKENILSILENAVNVSDMLDDGEASEIGAQRTCARNIQKHESESKTVPLEQRNFPEAKVAGVNFGLRGGDEHRNLTTENFKILEDQDGVKYIAYCESISKTYKGGIKHRKINPHKARAYEKVDGNRCPVKLFQEYVSKLNRNSPATAFYFQPLTKPVGDVWFSLSPVGHNKLKDFVKDIMKTAGFEGYFTNHSLRATTATRLFQEHIPEQLIMEQTGHRSTAIYSYKRASDEQKRHVSNVLQGLSQIKTNTAVVEAPISQHVSVVDKPVSQHVFNMSNSEIHIHMKESDS